MQTGNKQKREVGGVFKGVGLYENRMCKYTKYAMEFKRIIKTETFTFLTKKYIYGTFYSLSVLNIKKRKKKKKL